MEIAEYNEIIRRMDEQINSIIHHQRVLADIYSELNRNRDNPFEQDYIYRDQYGGLPSDPVQHNIGGVKITTRVLHQTGHGLSDIMGADLLYEIQDVKYVLIQYKRLPVGSTSFTVDAVQLNKILNNCPSICIYRRNIPKAVPTIMNGYCGCFYRVITKNESKFLPACEVGFLSSASNSVPVTKIFSGLSKDTFEELFASCRLGALTRVRKPDKYIGECLSQWHLILHVLQNGQW